jgi:malonyl CoA-acyl carrier protein transacylase
MTVYVFPGQGSQVKGMGEELFSAFPAIVRQADQLLGYSIESLCIDDPKQQLDQTQFTQPALYTVNALYYEKKRNEHAGAPAYVAGHSLGEYNALLAANVFDFATGLKLVQKRGALMSEAAGGAMAAVIGLDSKTVQTILQDNNLPAITIANYNTHQQVVISGSREDIASAESYFLQAKAKLFVPLKVSGAFHSPLMEVAKQQFATFLETFTFASPSIPVIANVSAKPYSVHEIPTTLAQQITHSVLWTQSIEYLLKQGETVFEEIGPKKVLSGLITRIQKGQ